MGVFVMEIQLLYRTIGGHSAVPLLVVSGQSGHPSVVFCTWTCNAHYTSISLPRHCRGLLRVPTLLGRLLHMDMQCTQYIHQSVKARSNCSWSLKSSNTPLSSSAPGQAMHTIHPSVCHGRPTAYGLWTVRSLFCGLLHLDMQCT